MSRTLGTGIDPEEPLRAVRRRRDALRAAQDDVERRTARFSVGHDRGGAEAREQALERRARLILPNAGATTATARPSSIEERWILARIDATRAELERDLAAFDFAHAVERLYHLTFDDFCDWYARVDQAAALRRSEDVRATALAALERLLKLLHPVMPHVTEEIWSNLPDARVAADRRAVARAGRRVRGRPALRSTRRRRRHALYRRSGVRIAARRRRAADLRGGRPSAADDADSGDVEAEIGAARAQEIERGEKMLANEEFVANAAPRSSRASARSSEQYRARARRARS